jgi:thiol-disulfide isomerase/thioredoxin
MQGNRMNRNCTVLCLAISSVIGAGSFAGCRKLTKSDLNVAFQNSHGTEVSLKLPCSNNCLASLKGKVVLVNFWATWCEPCKAEIPSLIQFQQKYSDKGFTLLGIAMDEDGASVVQPFVEKMKFDVDGHPTGMNYPIVIGSDSVADKFGGLIGYPTSVLLTRDGKIAKTIVGPLTPEDFRDIQALVGS